jgi:hypothetical protein
MKVYTHCTLILLFLSVGLTSGCAIHKKTAEAKAELLEKKKKHDNLYEALSQKKITQGATTDSILEKFGTPDDVFKSGSATSSLEVWTYDRISLSKTSDHFDLETVVLYFDNNRLISWKF